MANHEIDRRPFLFTAAAVVLARPCQGAASGSESPQAGDDSADEFPRQPAALVQAVVGASHRDLEEVRRLVQERPALANASWDWGFGDWETALGAASHTGQVEIAKYLVSQGARPDIFYHAMMGHLAAVRAIIESQTGIQRSFGPHGISLLRHAKAGGEAANDVVRYLESLGDAGNDLTGTPLTPDQISMYSGEYFVNDIGVAITISESKGALSLQRGENAKRGLIHRGLHQFSPVGAPLVRLEFSVLASVTTSLTIRDGRVLTAVRR